MSEIKIWKVFQAARYIEGVLQEEFDMRYMSQGQPDMVSLGDYRKLEHELAIARGAIRDGWPRG